jgi:NTE family protein
MQADGVFQGGGVKGLGLVGALEAFADQTAHPDKYVDDWVSLAGTSAGAIVAAYLACGHDVKATAALVKAAPYPDFCDYGPGGKFFGAPINLLKHHGLAHGEVFHTWFREQIDGKTFGDIHGEGRVLKMIAADITRREMLVLPDGLKDYRDPKHGAAIDADSFEVADAVRMSMSIPFFFTPIELVHDETGLPSTIVDGGVLSNFPVWIFDVADRDPVRPTFGFKLIGGRSAGSSLQGIMHALGWPVQTGADIFHTASDAWDKYWVRHSTYVRTCTISAGDIGTTDFNLTDTQKEWLLGSGRDAGNAFLSGWDPSTYVNQHGRTLDQAATRAAAPSI